MGPICLSTLSSAAAALLPCLPDESVCVHLASQTVGLKCCAVLLHVLLYHIEDDSAVGSASSDCHVMQIVRGLLVHPSI